MELSLNSSYAFVMCYFIKYGDGILYVVRVTTYFEHSPNNVQN
jgi:hypothetical protein